MLKSRIVHKIRRTLWPYIHRKKERIGEQFDTNLYAKYAMYEREYIISLNVDIEYAYKLMNDLGFSYEPIAALKIWKPTGKIEDGSFARREGVGDPYQLHIHLFKEGDEVIFAGHYEYSWITHPYKHYRGHKMEFDTAEEMFLKLLDEHAAGEENA